MNFKTISGTIMIFFLFSCAPQDDGALPNGMVPGRIITDKSTYTTSSITSTIVVPTNLPAYEKRIANFVNCKFIPSDKNNEKKYNSNHFVIDLFIKNPSSLQGQQEYNIVVVDQTIKFSCMSSIPPTCDFKTSRNLSKEELADIKKLLDFSDLKQEKAEIPFENTKGIFYREYLFVKNKEKIINGGRLSPMTTDGAFADLQISSDKVDKDLRDYSASFKGNPDSLIKALKTYAKFDSIMYVYFPG